MSCFGDFEDHLKKYLLEIFGDNRRKFRSQTSDNMDRWKAETGRVREKRRVEERRSEKRKSQKMSEERSSDARKGRKVAKHCVFPMICGSGGSKSRLAKAAGAEPSGQMRDEKVHAVGARSTFASEKAKNTSRSERFWKLRCRKSARRCGAKHISKSKCTQHTILGPLLEVEMSKSARRCGAKHNFEVKMYKAHHARTTFGSWKKRTLLWRKAHFEVKMLKTPGGRTTFGRSDVVSRGRRKGLCTLSKVSKTWRFWSISKDHGRRGTFADDLQRCLFRGRRSTRDIFIRAVRRSGRWFPKRGCILEHQIFRFAEMILRDRRSTSYDLASLFRGRRGSLDRWTGKIAKHIGTRPSALHSTSHFWRKSRRIDSFLMLSTSKFVSDVVKFKNWGCLAELLRFWRCQLQTLRTSRRIAAFLMLSSSKPEDVSQDSFVFKLADRQVDR